MEESILSCDSKQHIRHGSHGSFRGLIGVALLTREPQNFKKSYEKRVESFFKKVKKYQNRKVYKSSEIGSLFPGRRAKVLSAYRKLARSILRIPNTDVNVYYFTLDLNELRSRMSEGDPEREKVLKDEGVGAKIITIYGEKGREGAQLLSVTEFFKRVREYFPIVCAWKLFSYLRLKDAQVVLDGCKGERSHAWEELVSICGKVTIAFGGDVYTHLSQLQTFLSNGLMKSLESQGYH